MEDKIKFLMPDGSLMAFKDYQEKFGLKGKQIAKHYYYTEPRFIKDLEDYDELIVCHSLMQVLDKYRSIKGSPVNVNSFNRDEAKQQSLHERGFKAAKFSPHVVKLAADVDTTTEHETLTNVEYIRAAAKILGVKVRIGYRQYINNKQTFIHIDVCPDYFQKGKPFHTQFHPKEWEYESTW